MPRPISLAEHVEEVRLADPPRRGLLRRGGRRHRGRGGRGTRLLLTDDGLVIAGPDPDRHAEIPWRSLRKAVVDDGSRWGYVSGVCRFPVYDIRADGSGSGVLIGPLWSQASSLMPEGCPVEGVDPAPQQAPNLVLILEPQVVGLETGSNGGRRESDTVAALLLRAQDPALASDALAARGKLGDVDHDDLEYLGRAAREPRRARRTAGEDASAASA